MVKDNDGNAIKTNGIRIIELENWKDAKLKIKTRTCRHNTDIKDIPKFETSLL